MTSSSAPPNASPAAPGTARSRPEAPGRRGFFARAAMWLGLVASYGTATAFFGRFLLPSRVGPRWRKVYVCREADLPPGTSRTVKDLRGGAIVLAHTERGLRALSTRCTHLGCRVHWDGPGKRFVCPCHMGIFDPDGAVVAGPPPAPLERYEVVVEAGMIYVAMKEA